MRSSCGREARYRYDDDGDLVRTERVTGDRRYVTDGAGRIVEVWDADGVRLCRNTFDADGRVLTQVSSFGREVTFDYRPGRRTVVSDTAAGPVNVYEHDEVGRLIGVADDEGHVLRRVFDDAGRVVAANGFDGGISPPGVRPRRAVGRPRRRRRRGRAVGLRRRRRGSCGTPSTAGPSSSTSTRATRWCRRRIAGPEGWEIRIESASGLATGLTDADGVRRPLRPRRRRQRGHHHQRPRRSHHGGVPPQRHGRADHATRRRRDPARPRRAGRLLVAARSATGDEVPVRGPRPAASPPSSPPTAGAPRSSTGPTARSSASSTPMAPTIELTHDHLERLVAVAAPGGGEVGPRLHRGRAPGAADRPGGRVVGVRLRPRGPSGAGDRPARARHRSPLRPRRAPGRGGRPDGGDDTPHARDALGRVTATDAPDGGTTTTARDAWGCARVGAAARR